MIRTLEIGRAIDLKEGKQIYSATLYTNQKHKAGGGITRGHKVGVIIGESIHDLLTSVAALIEQTEEKLGDQERTDDQLELLEDLLEGRL